MLIYFYKKFLHIFKEISFYNKQRHLDTQRYLHQNKQIHSFERLDDLTGIHTILWPIATKTKSFTFFFCREMSSPFGHKEQHYETSSNVLTMSSVIVKAEVVHACKQDSVLSAKSTWYSFMASITVTAHSDGHRWIYNQIMDQTDHSVSCLRIGLVCVWGCCGGAVCVCVCAPFPLCVSPLVCLDLVSTDKSPLNTSHPTSVTFFWAFSLNCQCCSIAGTLKHFKSHNYKCAYMNLEGSSWVILFMSST